MDTKLIASVCLLSLVGLLCPITQADTIPVANASFEAPDIASNTIVVGVPTSWESVHMGGRTGTYVKMADKGAGNAPDGDQVLYIKPENSDKNGAIEGGYRVQNLAALDADPFSAGITIAANTVYSLTVSARKNADSRTFGRISLLGSSVEAPADPKDYLALESADVTTTSFTDYVVTLDTSVNTAAVGQYLKVGLHAWKNGSGNREIEFDNVRLSAVPEPATLSLLALGGLALIKRRK